MTALGYGAWCRLLDHQCDGLDGICPCECHIGRRRPSHSIRRSAAGRPLPVPLAGDAAASPPEDRRASAADPEGPGGV